MINSCTSIKNIELPKYDSRCAAILRTVINNLKEKENESRSASYLWSKVWKSGLCFETKDVRKLSAPNQIQDQSRTASIVGAFESIGESITSRNKIFALRKVMFGAFC